MEVVPSAVGQVSRAWDEQHLHLSAASGQVGSAPTSGFTDGVSGAAARFLSDWQRHVEGLATEAEARADGLRSTIADFLRTDDVAGAESLVLLGYLREVR